MPKLTDPDQIEVLRQKVATMTGTATEIADELNAVPTVEVIQSVATSAFLEAVSPPAYATIRAAANSSANQHHADAAWLMQALSAGEVTATVGSRGRTVLEVLINSGVLSAEETAALIAAATVEVREGESWAQANEFGRIRVSYVLEVMDDGDSD